MYYLAKIKFETVDDQTGRTRKISEEYLVEAMSISDAEEKLNLKFKEGMAEMTVISVRESKIMGIVK
jgi:hypothetical protein